MEVVVRAMVAAATEMAETAVGEWEAAVMEG
jgi:hypothetical protein